MDQYRPEAVLKMMEIQYADSTLFLTDTDIQLVIIVASSHLICRQNCQEYVGGFREYPINIAFVRIDKGQLAACALCVESSPRVING